MKREKLEELIVMFIFIVFCVLGTVAMMYRAEQLDNSEVSYERVN